MNFSTFTEYDFITLLLLGQSILLIVLYFSCMILEFINHPQCRCLQGNEIEHTVFIFKLNLLNLILKISYGPAPVPSTNIIDWT